MIRARKFHNLVNKADAVNGTRLPSGAVRPPRLVAAPGRKEPAVGRSIRPRRASGLLTLAASLITAVAGSAPPTTPGPVVRDFDHDGIAERLVHTAAGIEAQRRQAQTGHWEKLDWSIPADLRLADEDGHDSGLRWVDLNGDGFDDILFSNPERYAIHLWNKEVRLDLGWMPGWSHFVKAGRRTGAPDEPPSLVGADVRVENGDLIITRAARDGQPATIERRSTRELIAFDMPPPQTPAAALASFRLPPGFRIELVAAEPLVVDPVYLDWDARGRLWVVEMRDYPLGLDGRGQPGGVVKFLEDTDGDGRYDKATTFLEGVAFPTSVMPWRNGVLVAAAPDLIYAEDTDGDGRADLRRVLFTGFTPGNQQHRFNGFEWGLDGWIYAANGDSGGQVKSLLTGQLLPISGRDVRFHPDTGAMETVSAQTQYGRRRDDWGHWFGNNNPTWLWHVTLPEHYLRRNPRLAVKHVVHVLANYDDPTRVFPVSAPMARPNQPWSLNHVTSGCSPSPYRDDLFGPAFATSVFISEPVHNVVHREVLVRDGAGFRSHRAPGEEQSEFLASTDHWFRPITVRTGPDGALYVADMYRFVLEHPEWISPELLARLEVRAGEDRGRIYRVVPEGRPRRTIPNLARMNQRELVAALDSPNGWQRDVAQQLLCAPAEPTVVAALQNLLTLSHAPQVRLQALATLGVLDAMSPALVLTALADPHPEVRCEALRQSEACAGRHPDIFPAIAALAADGEAPVRLQAAFSLGAWPAAQSEPVLRELAARPDADELLRVAVMSSLRPESALFEQLNRQSVAPRPAATIALAPSSADRAQVIAKFSGVEQLSGSAARGQQHFQALCAVCHRLNGAGHEVGPDLGMVATKPVNWLLLAILDPNQAVEARYRAWNITLKSEEELTGIISAETANNLVIRMAGGVDHAVLRSEIATIEQSQLSLMPVGFESALTPQDLADLIQWLRTPAPAPKSGAPEGAP
ncbi:MAG TPA: HEAT repeat domain-containing protein [Verrucomicrobiota bacterium]|nr:HEAT repeat domain-containing protein [Verrucomicrobiota bacterium]HNT14884.1 HEAT repeat domain-containing protein [Verrucomicrobiota bacterium]